MNDIILSGASVDVHLHVVNTTVAYHCAHDDDRVSLTVRGDHSNLWSTPDLYVIGTAEELIAFARRMMQAVVDMEVMA